MTDFEEEIMRSLSEKVNKQIADDVIERCMTDMERENQKRRAAMSGNAKDATSARGFQTRAMVNPQDGTVHSLTTREKDAKRGKLVSTPVRILTEERYLDIGDEINARAKIITRVVETLNELATDHDRNSHMPRTPPFRSGADLNQWNKACDDTIVRHHERQKALISYRESELGREQIREDGGISRAILNVIEELEAVLQTRLNRKASPRIEHLSEGEETVITIRIPEGAKSHIPMNFDER